MQAHFPPPEGGLYYTPMLRQKPGAAPPIMPERRSPGADYPVLGRSNGADWDGSLNVQLAARQNHILEERISALERELRPQQLSNALPPTYSD
jgi:hypothetical protein